MIKLNDKQKEILIANMFEEDDFYWLGYSADELKSQKIEIKPSSDMRGWWEMIVNGKSVTQLNFIVYEDILANIKKVVD